MGGKSHDICLQQSSCPSGGYFPAGFQDETDVAWCSSFLKKMIRNDFMFL